MTHRLFSLAALLTALPFAACECEVDRLDEYALPGAIAGVVCDTETGLPLGERTVGFDPTASTGVTNGLTDETGAFRLEDLPAGPGRLVVTSGEQNRAFELDVLEGETTVFEDPSCRPAPGEGGIGAVEGQICNRHVGDYVQAAAVKLRLPDGAELSTSTDGSGFFHLGDVPSGEHVLHVVATGYQRSFLVQVSDAETTVLEVGDDCAAVDQTSGLLSGALCDPAADGAPLAGADVYVTDAAGDWFQDVSDLEGSFLAGPMAPGLAEVRVVREPDVDLTVSAQVTAGGESVAVFDALCGDPTTPPDPTDPSEPEDPTNPPDPTDPTVTPDDTGDLAGRVCAPDGETWLGGALVWITIDGVRYDTTADGEGRWQLTDVPVGTWTLNIHKGSFSTTLTVTVGAGTVVTLPEDECAIGQEDLLIAVVNGSYDDVYSVLINVGVDDGIIDQYQNGWADTLLGNYALLATYDIVLINCGAEESDFFDDDIYAQNLRQYVQSGGSLYASDWAYDFVEDAFPSYIDFLDDDTDRNDAQRGLDMDAVNANIVDVPLAGAMGQSSLEIHYQLQQWAVMTDVSSEVRVYLRADADIASGGFFGGSDTLDDVPHTVGFEYGQGKVIYTSFHQEPGLNVDAERLLQLLVFEL